MRAPGGDTPHFSLGGKNERRRGEMDTGDPSVYNYMDGGGEPYAAGVREGLRLQGGNEARGKESSPPYSHHHHAGYAPENRTNPPVIHPYQGDDNQTPSCMRVDSHHPSQLHHDPHMHQYHQLGGEGRGGGGPVVIATQQQGETVPSSSSRSFPSHEGASAGRDCWVYGEHQGSSTLTSGIHPRGDSPPPVIIGSRHRSDGGERVTTTEGSISSRPPHEPILPPPQERREPLLASAEGEGGGCAARSGNLYGCDDHGEGVRPLHPHGGGGGDVHSMPIAPRALPFYRCCQPREQHAEGCHPSGSREGGQMGLMMNGCNKNSECSSSASPSSVHYCHPRTRDAPPEDFYDPSTRVLLPPHLSSHQIPPPSQSYYEQPPPYEEFSSIRLCSSPRDHVSQCLRRDPKALNDEDHHLGRKKENLLGEGGESARRLSPSPSESLPYYTVHDDDDDDHHHPCIRRLSSEESHDAALRRARHQYLKRGGGGGLGGTPTAAIITTTQQYVCAVDGREGENAQSEIGSSSQTALSHPPPVIAPPFAQVSSCSHPASLMLPPDQRGVHHPHPFLGETPGGGHVPPHPRPSPSLIEEARARGAAEADRFFQRFQQRQHEMMMNQRRAAASSGGGVGGGDEVVVNLASSFQETTVGFVRDSDNRSGEGLSHPISSSSSSRQSYGGEDSSRAGEAPRQIFRGSSSHHHHHHPGRFFHIHRRSYGEERAGEGENTRGFLPNEEGVGTDQSERMMSSCCSEGGGGGRSISSSGHSQGNASSSQQPSGDCMSFSSREEGQAGVGVYSFPPAFPHTGGLDCRGGHSGGGQQGHHPSHGFSSSYEGRGGEEVREKSSCSASEIDPTTLRPPCPQPSLTQSTVTPTNTAAGGPAPSSSLDLYSQRRPTGDDQQQQLPPPLIPGLRRPEVPFRDEHQEGREGALGIDSYNNNNSRNSDGARPARFDYGAGGIDSHQQTLPSQASQLLRTPLPHYACPSGRHGHQDVLPPPAGFVPSSSTTTNVGHPNHLFFQRAQQPHLLQHEQSCFPHPSFLDMSRGRPQSIVTGREEEGREESRSPSQQLCPVGGSAPGVSGEGDVVASFSSDLRPSRWGDALASGSTSDYLHEPGRRGALNGDGKPTASPLCMMDGRQEGGHIERCPPVLSSSCSQPCCRLDGHERYSSSCCSRPVGFFYGPRNGSRGEGGGGGPAEQGDTSPGCWMEGSRRQMDKDREETKRGSDSHRERQGGGFPSEIRAASDSRIGPSREKMVFSSTAPGEGGAKEILNEETHPNQEEEEAKVKRICEDEGVVTKGEERHKKEDNNSSSSGGATETGTSGPSYSAGSGSSADAPRGSSHVVVLHLEGDLRNGRGSLLSSSSSGGRRMNDIEEEPLGGVGVGRRKHPHPLYVSGMSAPPASSSSSSDHQLLSGQECCCFFTSMPSSSSSASSLQGGSSLLPPPPPPHHHGAMRSLSEHATPSCHNNHSNSNDARGRSISSSSQSLGEGPLIRDSQYNQVLSSHDGSISRSFPGLLEVTQLYPDPRGGGSGRRPASREEGHISSPSVIDDHHEDLRQPVRYTSLDRGVLVPTHDQGFSGERHRRSSCIGGDGSLAGGGGWWRWW